MTPTSEQEPEHEGPHAQGAGTPPPVDELRLALVCDGGVSLAIYEHGIATELDNVVVASRVFDLIQASGDPGGPHADLVGSLTPVQAAYLDALRHPRDDGGLRSVVVDVIAGSSAGGINGVFLAKALSGNHATDALTTLWLDKASFFRLLLPSGPARRRGSAPAPKPVWSPFNGDAMARWVMAALEAMDATTALVTPGAADPASLLRTGQELDLFVTATDLRGYFRRVPSPDGGDGDVDRQNRKVFHFAPTSFDSGFGPRANGGLAFAARATSCFPGAFAPVCVAHVEETLRRVAAAVPLVAADFEREHLSEYALIGADTGSRLFVDGGVLDNRPFDVMIGAIAAKSAQTRVDRRIVHIDPDPATWEDPSSPAPKYGFVSALQTALGLMKSRSTLGDLADVQAMNAEIDRVGTLTAQLHDAADASLTTFIAPSGADYWRTATAWAPHVYDSATTDGWNRNTYQRLKVDAIGAMMAADLATALGYPPATQHLVCVEHLLSTWSSSAFTADGDEATPFLRRADLPFQERRLRFLIARVNDLYPTATGREDRLRLDDLKGALWSAQVDLVRARAEVAERLVTSTAGFLGTPRLTVDDVARPRAFASTHGNDLTALIASYADALWEHWDGVAHLTEFFEHRESCAIFEGIIRDFLWFPVWDAAVFPTIALAKLPQLTPITLSRFSPADATLLQPVAGRSKLQGTAVRNFGGFLSRGRRENDYVWGRFDGVELTMRLLGSSTLDEVAPAFRALAQELAAAPSGPDSSRPLLRTSAARRLLAHVRSQLPLPA